MDDERRANAPSPIPSPLIGSVYTVRYTPHVATPPSPHLSLSISSCVAIFDNRGLVTFVFLRAHIDNIYQKSFFIKLSETFREATITEVPSKGQLQILLNPRNMHAVGPSLRRASQFFHRQQEPKIRFDFPSQAGKKRLVLASPIWAWRFANPTLATEWWYQVVGCLTCAD